MTGVHLPLALRVAAPVAGPYAWRLAGAGALVLVQVVFVLAKAWPLALAVDHGGAHPTRGFQVLLPGYGK
jgi:hypothetical protein